MKVLIVTDPPTVVRFRRSGEPYFSGSFSSIVTLQSSLRELGHTVETAIALPTGNVVNVDALTSQARSTGLKNLDHLGQGEEFSTYLRNSSPDALVLSLMSSRLLALREVVLAALEGATGVMQVFVVAGPQAGRLLGQEASARRLNITLLERPGVARLTRAGLSRIVSELR